MAEPVSNAFSNAFSSAFSTGISNYLSNFIFPSIILGLNDRGVILTVDDLMTIIRAPTSSNNNIVLPNQNNEIPTIAFGGAVPPTNNRKAPNTAKEGLGIATNPTALVNPTPGKCSYQFKRGDYKNLYCGKPVAPGSIYCTNCIKNRKGLNTDLPAPGVAPNATINNKNETSQAPNIPGYNVPEAETPTALLNVVEYDSERGLYKEPTHNFIVHQGDNGVIAVIGKLFETETEKKIIPLTESEKTTAHNIGLFVPVN